MYHEIMSNRLIRSIHVCDFFIILGHGFCTITSGEVMDKSWNFDVKSVYVETLVCST